MIIHLYAVCYNEKDMLPYFLKYYETIVDKMFIFDNESTDGSDKILKSHSNVQAFSFKSDGINDSIMTGIYNEAYKKHSRGSADWIICADIDEIILSPRMNLRDILQEMLENNVMIPHMAGFQMVSERFIKSDKQIYEICKWGVRDPVYDKTAIFRPEIDINFHIGRHRSSPVSDKYLLSSWDSLALLHYKFFGRQRYLDKQKESCIRISETNKKNKYGLYHKDQKKANEFFSYTLNCAREVIG